MHIPSEIVVCGLIPTTVVLNVLVDGWSLNGQLGAELADVSSHAEADSEKMTH